MSGRLEGKTAIVVGAGSIGPGWGNGKASAALFAREGANVLCVDVNENAAMETRDIIRDEGGTAEAFACNATDERAIKDMVAFGVDTLGAPEILHNNVGILRAGTPIDTTVEEWDLVMEINGKSVFLPCKHVLPHMLELGRGSIINMSSITGFRNLGAPYIAYNTSKGSIVSFTRNLAATYAAQGIRANSILPGNIDTPMAKNAIARVTGQAEEDVDFAELAEKRGAGVPMKRTGTAWDVAKAALFLASEDAAYITGSELYVDGGLNCVAGAP